MDAKMVNVTKEWFRKTTYLTLIWMCGFNTGKQVVGKIFFKYLIKVRHILKSHVQNKGNFFYNIYITKKQVCQRRPH